jgi:Cdc6-like AAA superfamily ATPase
MMEKNSKIIKPGKVRWLDVNFVPPREKILYREALFDKLFEHFKFMLFKGRIHLCCWGYVGTGKTLLVRSVLEDFELFCNTLPDTPSKYRIKTLYLTCKEHQSYCEILRELIKQMDDEKHSKIGYPRGDYGRFLLEHCKNYTHVVIVLDDCDKAKDYDPEQFSDLIYFFTRATPDNNFRALPNISLVLITNRIDFPLWLDGAREKDRLDFRSRSTFDYISVYFEEYKRAELYDIARSRAEEALQEGTYTEGLLFRIAEISYDRKLGARGVVELLSKAAHCAQREDADRISLYHLEAVWPTALEDIMMKPLRDLLTGEQLILQAIYNNNNAPTFTKDIYEAINKVYPTNIYTFRSWINRLKDYHYIETKVEGRGRGKGVQMWAVIDEYWLPALKKFFEERKKEWELYVNQGGGEALLSGAPKIMTPNKMDNYIKKREDTNPP